MRSFTEKRGVWLLCCILALFAFLSVPLCYGQNLSGMTGLVTDQSGAAVPNVAIVLENKTTALKYTTTANEVGYYRFSEIPPGQGYQAVFTAKGFAPIQVKEIYLTVGTIRTQNVILPISAQQEVVEVTATNSEVTIDTTSASVGNTFDVQDLNNLPVQQRGDPLALFQMQPGVTNTGSVTGARVDQNDVTLDGMDVNDLATGGATQGNNGPGVTSSVGTIVGHAPVDAVEEFRGNVAGTDATTGAASGGQFMLVTKSGTNTFHGNLNEYHRDASLVANSWFSNNSSPMVSRNHLIQNQFGGNVGGPVMRNKLFFFFDFNDSRIVSQALVQRTVPSNALRNGTVSYYDASGNVQTKTEAQIKPFDPAGIGVDDTWKTGYTARFPVSNNNISGDGINSLGYNFNAPNNNYETNYVGRGDYNISDNMKLFARFTIARQNSTHAPNEFKGDPETSPYVDRSYAFVVGHNWVIGDNKTNRFYLGDTVQKVAFPKTYNPMGSTSFTFGDGADQALSSNFYINPSSQSRRVPVEMVGDDFTMTKGHHTLQMGATFKGILAHNTTVADYNTVEVGLGGNALTLCGPTAGACGIGNPSLRPSDIDPKKTIYWDETFAFLLGRIANVQSDYNYDAKGSVLKQLTGDQRFYKYYQAQTYFQDSWKVVPSLTVSLGLTYQWFSVPYETRGLESVEPYTFNQYFQARVNQSNLGQTGAAAVPLISYLLGGKGNGPEAPGIYGPEYRNMAPHFGFSWNPIFDKKMVINGSAGIVYDRTIINAVQQIQDADSYLFQQTKATPYGIAADPYNSLLSDPRLDSKNGISNAVFTPPSTPKPPYQPFVDASGNPNGLQNGLAFNATIDPAMKTPYSLVFNAGMQRSMPWDMVLKVNYVGRMGRRLLAQADAEQVLDFVDATSGELLSTAWGTMVTQTRQGVAPNNLTVQPWFENLYQPGRGVSKGSPNNTAYLANALSGLVENGDFADFMQAISTRTPYNVGMAAQFSENTFYYNGGFSAYNGLLTTLSKNMSHGLHFDFNYTWAHSIDNTSFFANSAGDTGIGGIGLICDVVRPRECRASSDFDIRHYVTADANYQLPFGKGRMFLATQPGWVNEILGSWDVSGLTTWHTGYPWSAVSNAFVASYSNNAPPIFTGKDRSVIKTGVTKLRGGGVSSFANADAAASSFDGPVGFKIGPRNSFRGPRFFNADMGLAKTFPITTERVNLKFRADAFNAFNHPNFDLPAENVFNGLDQQDYQQGSNFGQISYTVDNDGNNGARVLQLSLRLEF